jgi:hypothetical protein
VTRHFCTYFDHNYLPRGMVMLESLHEHCPEAHVHVLCLSDECHAALSSLAYPFVSLLRLSELEAADPELAATRQTRSLMEYYFTITPCLPWHLLTRLGLDEVTYLDADMMFFSAPESIFAEAGDASVIITPHRFSVNLMGRERYGLYNVSWLTFRKTEQGLACLEWYRKACLEWCYDVLDGGRFADQKYLDAFPAKFAGVHVMEHLGGGLAPWNLRDADISRTDSGIRVADVPLIFYHAHGVRHFWGPLYGSGLYSYGAKLTNPALILIFKLYIARYARAQEIASRLLAGFDFAGIRQKKNLAWLRSGKHLLTEAFNGSLIWL